MPYLYVVTIAPKATAAKVLKTTVAADSDIEAVDKAYKKLGKPRDEWTVSNILSHQISQALYRTYLGTEITPE
jgi:hypothetical protein